MEPATTVEQFGGSSKDFKYNRNGDVIEMMMLGKLMDCDGIVLIASEGVNKTFIKYDEDEWKLIVTTPPIIATHNTAETKGMTYCQIRNKISKEPWKKLKAELRAAGIPCAGRMIWHEENEDPDQFLEEDDFEEGEKYDYTDDEEVVDPKPTSDQEK